MYKKTMPPNNQHQFIAVILADKQYFRYEEFAENLEQFKALITKEHPTYELITLLEDA